MENKKTASKQSYSKMCCQGERLEHAVSPFPHFIQIVQFFLLSDMVKSSSLPQVCTVQCVLQYIQRVTNVHFVGQFPQNFCGRVDCHYTAWESLQKLCHSSQKSMSHH